MALVLALTVFPSLAQFAVELGTMDEAILVLYPEQILAGRIPHKDFFTVYGPGGFGALAALFAVTGPSVIAERALGLLYHAAITVGVLRLTSPFGRFASSAAGMTSALVLVPVGLAAFAWFGGLALALWSLALLSEPARSARRFRLWVTPWTPKATTFIAGVLGGLVGVWRLEMLILLLASGPLIWKTRRATYYLTGVAVGLLPMAAFLMATGSKLIENVFLSRLKVNAQVELGSVPLHVWLGLSIALLITFSLGLAARRDWRQRRLVLTCALLSFLLLPQGLQRIDLTHLIYIMCVIAPMGVAVALRAIGSKDPGAVGQQFTAMKVFALTVLPCLTLMSVFTLNQANVTTWTHHGRSTRVAAAHKAQLSAELRLITQKIPPGSRIFIGPEDMSWPSLTNVALYHLLPEYRADAYYLELPPGVAEKPGSALLNDVLHADALILTDFPRKEGREYFPNIGRGGDGVNQAIAANFCLAGRVPTMSVYRKC